VSQAVRSVRDMPFLAALRRLFTTPAPARPPAPPSYVVVPRPLTPPARPLDVAVRQAVIAQIISGPDTPLLDKAVYVATPFVVTAAAVHGAQQALARGAAPAPRRLP